MKYCKIGKGRRVHQVEWLGTYATYMECRLYTHNPSAHPGPTTCKKCLRIAKRQEEVLSA